MIEYNEKEYHLKFNLERLKLVEGALKKPLITVYTEHGGAFSIDEMEKIFQLCLKERNADTFCGNGLAREIFKNCIELENGYATVNNLIATQLYEDCPFLFPKLS